MTPFLSTNPALGERDTLRSFLHCQEDPGTPQLRPISSERNLLLKDISYWEAPGPMAEEATVVQAVESGVRGWRKNEINHLTG